MASTATANATTKTTTSTATATLRDMAQYEAQNLSALIKDALTGESDERITNIVDQFMQMDIECSEDLTFLAKLLKTADALCKWLNNNTNAPTTACSRVANFLFS